MFSFRVMNTLNVGEDSLGSNTVHVTGTFIDLFSTRFQGPSLAGAFP